MRELERTLRNLGLAIEVVIVPEKGAFTDLSIEDIESRGRGAFFVVQINRRDGDVFTDPDQSMRVEAGDGVVVVGRGGQAISALFDAPSHPVKAGRTTFCRQLAISRPLRNSASEGRLYPTGVSASAHVTLPTRHAVDDAAPVHGGLGVFLVQMQKCEVVGDSRGQSVVVFGHGAANRVLDDGPRLQFFIVLVSYGVSPLEVYLRVLPWYRRRSVCSGAAFF